MTNRKVIRIMAGSGRTVMETIGNLGMAWKQSDLDAVCRHLYGLGWTWNETAQSCIKIEGGEPMENDERGQGVSHADRTRPGSLRGTMIHRSVKTMRGTSVVPDKTDRRERKIVKIKLP